MNTTFIIIWLILGLAAGIYNFGSLFAWKQETLPPDYPEETTIDYVFCLFFALVGLLFPFTAIFCYFISERNKYGWRIK